MFIKTNASQCSVLGCANTSSENSEIGYYSFPYKEKFPILYRNWVISTRRNDFTPTANSVICGIHFRDEDFNQSDLMKIKQRLITKKPRLNEGVIPTMNLGAPQNSPRLQNAITPERGSEVREKEGRLGSSKGGISVLSQAVQALQEISNQNSVINEFQTFGQHVAAQLEQLPLKDALEIETEIIEIITARRMKLLKENESRAENIRVDHAVEEIDVKPVIVPM